MIEYRQARFSVLSALVIAVMVWLLPVLSSCSKNAAVSPTASSTKLLIVDATPDFLPMYIYIGSLQLGGPGTLNYPTVTSYYSVYSGAQTTRINDHNNTSRIYINDTLANNTSYSLFVVGLLSASKLSDPADTLNYILTADTSAIPKLGYGKVRFINASARTAGLDVYANGTQAFTNIGFRGVSKFIQMPAGTYAFKINPTATPASTLTTLNNVTVQDGRIYTLYTYGLVGRTDSAAFTASVITNQ